MRQQSQHSIWESHIKRILLRVGVDASNRAGTDAVAMRLRAATWNLKLSGNVYAVTAGPYGTILALCWSQRNDPTLEAVNVVLLTDDTTGQMPVA